MKTTFKNLIYIALAFAIGVSINSACGDNLTTQQHDNGNIEQTVAALQKEINSLKNRISELEQKNSGTPEIDGLIFNENGQVASKPISMKSVTESDSFNQTQEYYYSYDNLGRISELKTKSYGSNTTPSSYTQNYSYNGKSVTVSYTLKQQFDLHVPPQEVKYSSTTTYR